MRSLTIFGLLALGLGVSQPTLAQNAVFEFQGETTDRAIDLSTTRNCRTVNAQGVVQCFRHGQQVAGLSRATVATSYYDSRLFRVTVLFASEDHPKVLQTFTETYGVPSLSVEDWKNPTRDLAGENLRNEMATWQFQGGTLRLDTLAVRIGQSAFEFFHSENGPPAEP
jgi:hypothetical protein